MASGSGCRRLQDGTDTLQISVLFEQRSQRAALRSKSSLSSMPGSIYGRLSRSIATVVGSNLYAVASVRGATPNAFRFQPVGDPLQFGPHRAEGLRARSVPGR